MQYKEALEKAEEILSIANISNPPDVRNFLEYGTLVAYAAKSLGPRHRAAMPWLIDWAQTWRKLLDNFDKVVIADPMVLYKPAHQIALNFHKSPAWGRAFFAANRTSKTQTGYAEHYLYNTNQHQWRYVPPGAHHTFIVAGLPFSSYSAKVFEAKFLTGEEGNFLSPMFPEGGKWFNHYDEREHILTIACAECAEAGKAGSCRHAKSDIKLFSCEQGSGVLQGQAYILGHFDEDTPEEMFHEARQRLKTVRHSGMIWTGTPLHGPDAYEQRIIAKIARNGPPENLLDEDDPNSQPLYEVFNISMWDAGLVPHSQIKMEMKNMDDFQIRARVYGEAVPLTNSPVFDRKILAEIRTRDKKAPTRCNLEPRIVQVDGQPHKPNLLEIKPESQFDIVSDLAGPLRIFEKPQEHDVYVLAADVAAGMREHDYSCASVGKITNVGGEPAIQLVAQWHGWINQLDFAAEIFKLAVYYNSALVAIELTGGYGRATMLKLKNELFYWNLHRELADIAAAMPALDARLGVETTQDSKAFMISALQRFINKRTIIIPDDSTIDELVAYEQVNKTTSGQRLAKAKFQGASGSNDDRVISLAILASIVVSSPYLGHLVNHAALEKSKEQHNVSEDMKSVHQWLKEEDDYASF